MHVDSFLNYLSHTRRLSPHTVAAYRNDLQQFTRFICDNYQITDAEILTHLHIRDWLMLVNEQGQTAKTIRRKLSCLKTWFRYLEKNQYITYNPMLKVSSPKLPKRLPSTIQEKQMDQMFELIDFGSDFSGIRNKCMIELLYATGMRRQELIQLQINDLDTRRGLVKVMGKGRKERLIPIPNYLLPLIAQYLSVREAEFAGGEDIAKHFFLTKHGKELYPKLVYQVVHKYLSMVSSAEQRSPHTLRHSFATHLSANGADLNAIKSLLGHSSLASTQVYMHNNITRLKAVYEQAHPKSTNDDEAVD